MADWEYILRNISSTIFKYSIYVLPTIIVVILLSRIRVTLSSQSPAHWQKILPNSKYSSDKFLERVREEIEKAKIPDLGKVRLVIKPQSHILSKRRHYLQVYRGKHTLYIGCLEFGTIQIISWWVLVRMRLFRLIILFLPFIGIYLHNIFWPRTFYVQDVEKAFASIIHNCVLNVIEESTESQGLELEELRKEKPIMKNIFQR